VPQAQEETREEKPRRPLYLRILRKFLKVFLWMLGILAGLLLLAWLVVLIFFPDEKIRSMLVAELEDRLGVGVQAGELDLEIFSGLSLKDVVIGPPPGFDQPPVRVERLVVDYSLGEILSKKLTVHQVLIDRPEIHIQVQDGKNNVSALLGQRRTAEEEKPPAAEPEDDEGGFTFALDQVEIRDAHLSLRLPGFSADLEGLDVTAAGKLGSPSETLINARADLPVPEGPNLSMDVDAGQEAPTKIRAALGFSLQTRLVGQSRVESSGSIELRLLGVEALDTGHHLTIDYRAHADGEAAEAVLDKLEVKLDDKSVLTASGGVTGLNEQARIDLKVPQLVPPPELIAEVLGRVLPGVEVAGSLHLENLSVEGPLDDSLPGASALVILDDLKVAAKDVRMAGLSGKLQAAFQPEEGGGEYTFQSALSAREGRLLGLRARGVQATLYASGSLQMQNGESRLLSPEVGAALRIKRLSGGGLDCRKTSFQGRITTGDQPVSIGSPDLVVPSLTASFSVSSDGAQAGSLKLRPGSVKLWLSVQELGLIGDKWQAGKLSGKLDLDFRKLTAGAATAERPRLHADFKGDGLALGQRFQRPVRLTIRARSGPASAEVASVQTIYARLGSRLRSLSPGSLPLTLNLTAGGVAIGPKKISLPGEVKLDLASVLDLRGRVLTVERLETGLGDLISLHASGKYATRERKGEAVFGIKPFSVDRALAALPADIKKTLPRVKGELELSGKTEVTLPQGKLELEKLKHTTQATLLLRGVQGSVGAGLEWKNLSGRLKLTAPGPGFSKTTTEVNLTAGKLLLKPAVDLGGVSLALTAKRDRGDFSLDGRVAAAKLDIAGLLARPLTNSQVEFYGQLAGTKELRLKYLKVALPSSGADLSVSGRFVRIPGAEGFEALRMSAKLEAGLHSTAPVPLPGGLTARGEGSLLLTVESGDDSVLQTRGRISFEGLNLKGENFEMEGIRGAIPVSQLIATRPVLGLLAKKPEAEKKKAVAASGRSRAYDEALLPMKGRQRSFYIDRVRYQDLHLAQLTGNLELAQGRLNLGSLRLKFLEGDVLAEAAVAFAPPNTRRLNLDAQVSGVDLSGLGALQLAGSSDISGNLRLKLDMGEKVFTAAANLTQIGRSTLQALLLAMDPAESNPGVQNLRRFLNRFKVSPKRVSLDIRHGLLSMTVVMNMGFTARAAAKLIQGFQGDTFKLKHLPIGGLLNKYLGF
jgi:hypothetical protein